MKKKELKKKKNHKKRETKEKQEMKIIDRKKGEIDVERKKLRKGRERGKKKWIIREI